MDFNSDIGKLIVTGLFGIAVAGLALFGSIVGAVLSTLATTRANRRTLFVNTVTAERAKWRQDQREALGNLCRLTHMALADPGGSLAELHESRISIRLRLNPSTDIAHALDQTILTALIELVPFIETTNRNDALACLERIEVTMQQLLKQEWDKSKREAISGKLVA